MTIPEKAIFMTFYPGLQSNHTTLCGSDITLETPEETKRSFNISIPKTGYSCEYRIKVPKLVYERTSKLKLWFERTDWVRAYIFNGDSRSNLTVLIENNYPAVVGAPYEVLVDDGLVIVAFAVYRLAQDNVTA